MSATHPTPPAPPPRRADPRAPRDVLAAGWNAAPAFDPYAAGPGFPWAPDADPYGRSGRGRWS